MNLKRDVLEIMRRTSRARELLDRHPRSLGDAREPHVIETGWFKSRPVDDPERHQRVLLLTEYGLGDPFDDPRTMTLIEHAVAALRALPQYQGMDVGWESIRPGVAYFYAMPHAPWPKESPMRHRPNPMHRAQATFTLIRVNRDPADTYAVEGEGEHAIRRAFEIAGPDPGDAVEFTTVTASDAGSARLRGQRWAPLPPGIVRANPAASGYRKEIIEGMAGALWVTSWADYCENLPDERRRRLREKGLIPGPGEDWVDAAPATPPHAKLGARRLADAIEVINQATLDELLERAREADGVAFYSHEDIDLFGHYLAMQSMGHGVSWFDDHAEFPLKFPFFAEAHYDGRTLHVSVRVR